MYTPHPLSARRVLASLSLVITAFLLIPLVGANPAEAAGKENEMTLDGITMKWTKADMSDVAITQTPGKADKLPNGLTADELETIAAEGADNQPKQRLSKTSGKKSTSETTLAAAPNGCSYSPDRWFKANFKPTCDTHDRCYSPNSSQNRLTCDRTFHRGLSRSCYRAYSGTTIRLNTCYGVAATYYAAVRSFGGSSYNGKGLNN